MDKHRLRPSIFPGCAPFLNFLPPDEEYEEEPMEELEMSFKAPPETSLPVLECFMKFGFSLDCVSSFVLFLL